MSVGIAQKRQRARVGQMCIADQVTNDVCGIKPSFQIIVGQEFDCAEPVFLILPVRLEIVFALGPQGASRS